LSEDKVFTRTSFQLAFSAAMASFFFCWLTMVPYLYQESGSHAFALLGGVFFAALAGGFGFVVSMLAGRKAFYPLIVGVAAGALAGAARNHSVVGGISAGFIPSLAAVCVTCVIGLVIQSLRPDSVTRFASFDSPSIDARTPLSVAPIPTERPVPA